MIDRQLESEKRALEEYFEPVVEETKHVETVFEETQYVGPVVAVEVKKQRRRPIKNPVVVRTIVVRIIMSVYQE
jgi:hypothetical protein